MASPQTEKNFAASTIGVHGFGGVAADDTYVTGQIVDRLSYGNPQSALAIFAVAYTAGSGGAGALNTFAALIEHDDDSAMGSAATLVSDGFVYTWAADGVNHGTHFLPADLSTANRYVRAKAKLTESGTITVTLQSIGVAILFGGLYDRPDGAYANGGYESVTEKAA